jgi:hypothetical protein
MVADHAQENRAGARNTVVVLKRPRCAQMFFIYPGMEVGMRGRRLTFLELTKQAGIGDRNLALVADPYRENYAKGTGADTPDFASLLGWHKDLLDGLPGIAEVYMLGYSSGGYGALLFGHLLGAAKVWAFVPRTARIETADRAKAFLREHLACYNGVTEYVIFYAPANRRDCAFAEQISRCPGIVLSPYTVPPPSAEAAARASAVEAQMYYHRNLLPEIARSGELRRIMPPFRKVSAIGDAADA